MKTFSWAVLAILSVVAPAVAVVESPIMGAINAPVAAAFMAAGSPFDFSYAISNWCEEGYNHFKVFLTAGTDAPTIDDVDDNGDIPDSLYDFGEYAVANFGKSHLR